MDPEKIDNRYNFHNFIKQQKEILETCTVGKSSITSVLEIDELFLFFNNNFKEFYHQDNFSIVLAFVHRCLKVWIFRGDYLKDDIGILLVNFILEHNANENDTSIALQIVYQVINSIKFFGCNDVVISDKLLRELAEILPLIESRVLVSNCIACMEKYMEMYPESFKNLENLWTNLKERISSSIENGITKEIEIDILMQLFDRFEMVQYKIYDEPVLINTIHHLLKSDQRKLRKCGLFLLKKFYQSFIGNINSVAKMWMPDTINKKIERSWTMYITIFDNLEEEQSHLILPSLENLDELIESHHLARSWLNILLSRLLSHNNNLVVRWSIEFVLKTFSSSDLCEETLKHLLKASNSNLLFNYEGYFLKDEYFSSFLKGNVTILLTLFSEIENWKSVPLFKWLQNLSNIKELEKSLTFNDILKFSACIRNCQNREIRIKAIEICNRYFKDYIEKMSVNEYILYIETLYNSSDNYYDHFNFYSKISSIPQSNEKFVCTQRFYEIFTNSYWVQTHLLSILKGIPVEEHGLLKYALFKDVLKEEELNVINNLYKLDLNTIASCSIHKIIKYFEERLLGLPPYDNYELEECNKAAIAFYIHQKPNFFNEDESVLTLIINSGMQYHQSLEMFARKLLNKNKRKLNLCFVDELLNYKIAEVTCVVFDYLTDVYDCSTVKRYSNIILKQISQQKFNGCSISFMLNNPVNLLNEITNAILEVLPSQGDKRIEELFIHESVMYNPTPIEILYSLFHTQFAYLNSESFVTNLITHHLSITRRKPRYFANSIEHRVKLRIAICIFRYFGNTRNQRKSDTILSNIWNILLNENNQLSVTYIYEFLLGKHETRADRVIQKLNEAKNLTSRQQVSIITVAYTYFSLKGKVPEEVECNLISLSMGANFQTRLFAQMSLYKLTKNDNSYNCKQIIKSIEDAAGDKIEDYLKDIRLNLLGILNYEIEAIMYITNAPFDEWFGEKRFPAEVSRIIEPCREKFISKLKMMEAETTTPLNEVNDHIQRKMNPIQDLTEPHSLIVYPTENKSAQMYVVASLIDKLPNLGGIARTCEVLGIQNLVMDSKMHMEKNDFKNLSMTAEKNLNILEVKPKDLKEFLISKKLEGFNIVGAEQTCKSQSFNNFQFPEKCVLLLGHEKDGIPASLLGVLDNAVEIPQFGQVRSLNVHVSGALFMWEYCKQHLITK